MPVHVIFAALMVAASVPLLWWALASDRQPAAEAVARNLAGGREAITDLRRALLQRSARERALEPAMAALGRRARRVTPAGMVEALDHKLALAGLRSWGIERVLAAKLGLALLGGAVGFLGFLGSPSGPFALMALAWVAVGFVGPDVVIGGRGQRRQAQLQAELPDSIDQIAISVEAGLGFEAAVARLAQTGSGPLAQELARMLQDIRLGVPRREAMDKLLERTDVEDLQRFVHAMRQAEGYGVPVAQVLRVQSAELRDKRRQRAEERAMKIPVKIIFPLVFCILPTLFIVILGPVIVNIVENGLF